ncbi:MAG: 50S ribosomal protein L6 [Candidatus Woesearchaeota archaeon]
MVKQKMQRSLEKTLRLPPSVTATLREGIAVMHGPKGQVTRSFVHPRVDIRFENGEFTLFPSAKKVNRADKMYVGSLFAHLKNMVKGVTEGFTYELKICSGHFPMSVSVQQNQFIVKNFIGEKVPRVMTIKPGATVKVEGDKVYVTAIEKELAGSVASDIEQLMRRPGFDNRVFQDGIYIINKAGKPIH